jgi:hypothetical protein
MVKHLSILSVILSITFFPVPHAYADAASGVPAGMEVTIANQPIKVRAVKERIEVEVLAKSQLKSGESKASVYIDVSGYEEVTLFVETFSETIFTKQVNAPLYVLDAFFSMTASTTQHRTMGGEEKRVLDQGVQEFGASLVEDNDKAHSNFQKLTTGLTAGRALHTSIYGKYMRVTLTNGMTDGTANYRVIAYFKQDGVGSVAV